MPVLLLALLVLVPCALPSSAEAQRDRGGSRSRADSRADSLFNAAQVAYEEERFEAAAELLEQAFELRPNPAFQFNLGRCYERLERWDDAERAYSIYQASVRNRAQEARAQERIDFVRRAREESRAASSGSATPVVTPPPEEGPPDDVGSSAPVLPPPASSGPSAGPFIVGGFGIAGLGVATAFTILAEDAHAQSLNAETGADAEAANRRANDYGLGATIAWIAGGTLLVAGTIWLIVELVGGTDDGTQAHLSERGLELRF